jgi:hypothetical protein
MSSVFSVSISSKGLPGAAAGIVALLLLPSVAAADGSFQAPTKTTALGMFGGTAYTQYEGIFQGQTSTTKYRVPYRLTAPSLVVRSNRTVIVEPPHFARGAATVSDHWLGRSFVFSRRFSHAAVGYGTELQTILDATVPGVYIVPIHGGKHITEDDEIVVDFARALTTAPIAKGILGRVDRRYVTGFSQSAAVVQHILDEGWAEGVFDLAFPFNADDEPNPQDILERGEFTGKVVMVGSEGGEGSFGLIDRGEAADQYRYYGVAGVSHNQDALGAISVADRSTPTNYLSALRAHFLQADAWVQGERAPPPSTNVRVGPYDFERDANGNAWTFETLAQPPRHAPRLPMLELGEARFRAVYAEDCPNCGFIATYDGGDPTQPVPGIGALKDPAGNAFGFGSFDEYFTAFRSKLDDLVNAGSMLDEDRNMLCCLANLGRVESKTYTEMYRDHYDVVDSACLKPPDDSCGAD